MTARPPQITENEAHVWQALSQAVEYAEKASLALARARQMMLREQTWRGVDAPFWALSTAMLDTAGVFASETLAERQRAACQKSDADLEDEAMSAPDEEPK